jgi:DNA polymerase
MLVGEQPGDREDRAGRPFVGPAGRLLDLALADSGLRRSEVYVTNVVKHFKWESRGKRRIHQRPNGEEIAACRIWLDGELAAVQPDVLVCLGATAARALIGYGFSVRRDHGRFVESDLAPHVIATIHPSAIVRLRDPAERAAELRRLTEDLSRAAAAAAAVGEVCRG